MTNRVYWTYNVAPEVDKPIFLGRISCASSFEARRTVGEACGISWRNIIAIRWSLGEYLT